MVQVWTEPNSMPYPIQETNMPRHLSMGDSWYTDVSESHICILTPFPLPTESHMFLGQYNIPPSSSSLTFQKPENKYYWYLPVFCMLTTRGTWRRDDNSSRSSIDVLGWTWNECDFSSELSNFIISHHRYSSPYLNPNKMNSLTSTWYLPVPLDYWWCCMFPLTHCQQLSDEKLPPQGHQLQFPLFPKEMEIIVQNSH